MIFLSFALAGEPPDGVLQINVAPADSVIRLDGETRGFGTMRLDGVPPGLHTLEMTQDGFVEQARVVEIIAGQITCVSVSLTPPPRPPDDPTNAKAKATRELIAASLVAQATAGKEPIGKVERPIPEERQPVVERPPPEVAASCP